MNHFADPRNDHLSILQVRDLTVAYKVRGGEIMAVEDVSFGGSLPGMRSRINARSTLVSSVGSCMRSI